MTVENRWVQLMQLLNQVAPGTAQSIAAAPASEVLARLEASSGLRWPPQLRAFFSMHGGQREYSAADSNVGGQILPAQDLFGAEQALSERGVMLQVWQGIADADLGRFAGGYDGLTQSHPEAGSVVGGFLPQYIPLSGSDGYFYFCDLRPGEHHGCVRAYYQDDADAGGPLWESISVMLDVLTAGIEQGRAVDGWEPRVADAQLHWQPEGSGDEQVAVGDSTQPVVIHTGYDTPEVQLVGDHDGPGADTDAIARAVGSAAAEKYGLSHVSQARTILHWVPQVPGFNVGCMVNVDGRPVMYLAVVTETPGQFLVHEVPAQGLRTER